MEIVFHNRNNDALSFSRLSENEFLMEGGQWLRWGYLAEDQLTDDRYSFVDPSGGPFISNGMTMGYINEKWSSKIVDYVTSSSGNVLIITYPERIIKASVNKEDQYRIYGTSGDVLETLTNFNDAVKWIEDKYERR